MDTHGTEESDETERQQLEQQMGEAEQGPSSRAQQQVQTFQRFVQAEKARAYGIEGTGLGLYLCRALIERHGERIWCESVEGQGSTFFIALPVVSEAASGR